MRFGSRALLSLLTVLFSTGCAHRPRSYATTDEFFASGRFPVPREFRNGTASLEDVYAWSSSLLNWNPLAQDVPPLQSLKVDMDGDAVPELFVCQPTHAGNGGNSYLAFQQGRRGFRYLGRLGFKGIRPAPSDNKGTPRLLTSWGMGAGEVGITLWALTADGFREIADCTLAAGDSGTAEGNRLCALLFESETVTKAALQMVFGAERTVE